MQLAAPEEYDAIMRVLQIYINAGDNGGDSKKVKNAFHEKAVMNGSGKDGYVFGPIQNLYDLYDKIGGDPKSICHAIFWILQATQR